MRGFDIEKAKERLQRKDFEIKYLQETDSTSNVVKRELAENKTENLPYAVIAGTQTAGRGRISSHGFFSPDGGLYFSCAFPASAIICSPELITVGTGVAVAKAIEKLCGCEVSLKWVNDVLVNGNKVGGILCESVFCDKIKSPVYIIGIGINTAKEALGDFMPEKVGALPKRVRNDELFAEILNNLFCIYADATESFLREYNARLSVCGKRVSVLHGGKQTEATVIGVSKEGLQCLGDDGKVICVRTCDDVITDVYKLSKS